MRGGTLDDQYLTWLYSQVMDVERPNSRFSTYWNLFRHLYTIEFTWTIKNDENRAEDGKLLRQEWASEARISRDADWFNLECSFLEMLLALAMRASFQSDDPVEFWFWRMIDNMHLIEFHDDYLGWTQTPEEVTIAADFVMKRAYRSDGYPGLFPLEHPTTDQRSVEIWYQLCEYITQG